MLSASSLGPLGLAAAVLFFIATWTGMEIAVVVLKPVPVLLMMAWVLGAARGTYGALLAAGLAFGALGDLLLALDGLFLPGLGAFLVGHLLYVAAFTWDRRALAPLRALPFALFAAGTLAALGEGLGDMAAPVAVYTGVISAMMWRASARVERGGERWAWLGLLGAMCFAFSDTMIAVNRFHTPFSGSTELVMGTYWLGQLGVTASAAGSLRGAAAMTRAAPMSGEER